MENITMVSNHLSLGKNTTMLNNWTMIKEGNPRVSNSEMVYDSRNREMVLFGSWNPSISYKTWTYNITMNTWNDMDPDTHPSARGLHAMAYDRSRGLVVLFGGYDGVDKDNTWIYNSTTNTWTEKFPALSPAAREGHAMVYDEKNKLIVLYGGFVDDKTWTYNTGTNSWVDRNPSNPPPGRSNVELVYDSHSGEVILFGGVRWDGSQYLWLNDTWTYNLTTNTWTNKNPSNAPSGRCDYAMAYDRLKKEVILFGGRNQAQSFSDTWIYNTTNNIWTRIYPAVKPSAVSSHVMEYYESGNVVMTHILNKTWFFDYNAYLENGHLTSQPYDTNGSAHFGNLYWVGQAPSGTAIRFQFRSADTMVNLSLEKFTGPDGFTSSFYETSGQRINENHNGSRWIQYRLLLNTSVASQTPEVLEVRIEYNLMHNLILQSPVGSENWTGIHYIMWNATDIDGDTLSFDILLESNSSSVSLVQNLNGNSWEWNTDTVQNGTYRIRVIARDDNTTIPLSVSSISGWFTIHHPRPNSAPEIILLGPEDGAIIHNSSVQLSWSGEDGDDDPLMYYVLFDESNASQVISYQNESTLILTDLEDSRIYFWTVIPNDGKVNGSKPSARRFTIDLPPENETNRPPVITSRPNTTARVGVEFLYLVEAFDPDIGDELIHSLDVGPSNMTIDSSTGMVRWIPGVDHVGKNNVTVNVTDGKDFATQSFMINVSEDGGPPDGTNNRPLIISTPVENAVIGLEYRYYVKAMDPDLSDILTFTLDISPGGMMIDPVNGLITWMPGAGDVGNHLVVVNVTDGRDFDTQEFTVHVIPVSINHNPVITSEPAGTEIDVGGEFRYQVIAVDDDEEDVLSFSLARAPEGMTINSTTGLIIWIPAEEDAGKHKITVNVTDNRGGYAEQTLILTVRDETAPPSSEFDSDFSLMFVLLIVAAITGMVIAVAAYMRKRAGAVSAGPAVIDDIFLIYRDGRLISHHTRKLKPDMDDEILGGMFTAVQEFIKTSFGDEEKAVSEITYGDSKILIEPGKYIFIAAVISGEGTEEMHRNMKTAVSNIEIEFGSVLEEWSGSTKELQEAKKWIKKLIAGGSIEPVEPTTPAEPVLPPAEERPDHGLPSSPCPAEISGPVPESGGDIQAQSISPDVRVETVKAIEPSPEPESPGEEDVSTRYPKILILKTLSSLPRGLPSDLLGPDMDELATIIARAEYARTPESIDIVKIDGDWYYGDPNRIGKYLQKYRGEVIEDEGKKLSQFNIETERRAGDGEIDMSGRKS